MQIVHENDNYFVQVIDTTKYGVVNKNTAVTEFEDPQLANVVTYAEHGNSFIINELWKWVAVQGAKNKETLDKEDAVIQFEPDENLLV